MNDLSSAETTNNNNGKGDKEPHSAAAIQLPANLNFKVLPSAIQLGGGQDGVPTIQSIPTIMANNTPSTIVQYATSGHEGQFIVPGRFWLALFFDIFCL